MPTASHPGTPTSNTPSPTHDGSLPMATPSPTPTPTPHNQAVPTMPGGSDSSTDEFEDDDDGLFYLPEDSDSIDGFQDDDNFFYFPDGEFDEPGATPAPRGTP
ncbi:unnamed protein product, partial [Ectocarpus sp. 12 AP-2014]